MKPNRTLFVIAGLLCGGMLMSVSAQNIISVSLTSDGDAGAQSGEMQPADLAGAPGARAGNWNNFNASILMDRIFGDNETIVYNDGSTVGGGFQVTIATGGGGSIFSDRANGSFINDLEMFNGVIDERSTTDGSDTVVTNIPFAKYDVLVYMRDDGADRAGAFIIGSITNYARGGLGNPANDGTGYILSTDATPGPLDSSYDQGNYVRFSNLTNSGFTLLTPAVNTSAGADRNKWAGFQIVAKSFAPATNISLITPVPNLLAGNPSGFTLSVLADLDDGSSSLVTTEPGISYSSTDANVFTVSTNGVISPKVAGLADLMVYFTNVNLSVVSLTQAVTVVGPISLRLLTVGNTNLYSGNNIGDVTTATLRADFSATVTNIDVTAFTGTVFSGGPGGVVTVASGGTITATGPGTFNVVASYGGFSRTNNPAGTVTAFTAPGTIQTLSFNIGDAVNLANFKDLSGAPGGRVAYWNNIPLLGGTASNQIASPLDYHGAIQAGTVITVTGRSAGAGPVTAGTLTTNEARIFRTMYDSGLNNPAGGPNGNFPNTSANEGIIRVANVPYAVYDAYFYCYNDNPATNRPGHFTLVDTGETRWRRNSATLAGGTGNNIPSESAGTGYIEAVPIISGGSIPNAVVPFDLAHVPEGNYVKFGNLTNETLDIVWGADSTDTVIDATTTTRLRLVGFQIVNVDVANVVATNLQLAAPVPNLLPGSPATFAVSALASFNDGRVGLNVTTSAGTTYQSTDTVIFTVSASGTVSPTATPGTANLIVTYANNVSSVSLTQAVTVLAPIGVQATATPKVLYIDSVLGAQTAQARLLATFNGQTNVDITSFATASFNDLSPAVATVNSAGVVTPVASGQATIGGNYLGVAYGSPNALTVRSVSDPATMAHRYSFRDAGATVVDSISGANGTLFPPTMANQPITLDGESANFPGDGGYTNAPYISLPAGLLSSKSDVTIELWCGQTITRDWARFFGAGSTPKGTDPHVFGGTATTVIELMFKPGGTALPRFGARFPAGNRDINGTSALANDVEHHIVMVYAPNQSVIKFYDDGNLVTTDAPFAGATLTTLNDQVVWLGVSMSNNDPPLAGWINELRIYEGAFTDADVAADFAAGPNAGLPPAERPTLSVAVAGGSVTLSWPTNVTDYVLQSNTVPSLPFFPIGVTPTVSGTNNTVTLPAGSDKVFFILQEP